MRPQDRRFVLETLINGLQRMEYRGYDSAGLEIEGDDPDHPMIFKEVGKVAMLKEKCMAAPIDFDKSYVSQTSIAHTRYVSSPCAFVHKNLDEVFRPAAGRPTVFLRVRLALVSRTRPAADAVTPTQPPTATRT